MTIFRALLLSVVAAGALVLPMADQLGLDQVWERTEAEDSGEVEDDADGPLMIELRVVTTESPTAQPADLEPADLEGDGVRSPLERPPRA